MGIDSEIRELARDAARQVIREELKQIEHDLEATRLGRPAPEPLLTVEAVAALCGVATKTVQRWIGRGLLRATRSPGMREYRITRRDYEAFTRGSPEPPAMSRQIDPSSMEREASRVLAAVQPSRKARK